jgi:hypothetical protein
MQYVGKTTSKFKVRANAHRNSVNTNRKDKKDQQDKTNKSGPVSEHFSMKNHTSADMLFFAFEKVVNGDPFIVGARERFYIDKMDVLRKGINKNRTYK